MPSVAHNRRVGEKKSALAQSDGAFQEVLSGALREIDSKRRHVPLLDNMAPDEVEN
jgi:hypothetical protein